MNKIFFRGKAILLVVGALLLFFTPPLFATSTQQKVEKPLRESVDSRQQTQKIREQWQAEKGGLLAEFESLQEEIKNLEAYQEKLQTSVKATHKRLATKKKQLAETEKINEEISPFLGELLERLREVSSGGLPFLAEERKKRLSKIEEMMPDPQITIGEKYRRLMEALQIEAEYGFTAEVYQQEIETRAGRSLVDIFRLGRLNLFYQSLDGRNCGFFDEATGSWQPLEEKWLREIASAIAMAKKEKPVEFVSLPLGKIGQIDKISGKIGEATSAAQ